jgi:hypothetical protein
MSNGFFRGLLLRSLGAGAPPLRTPPAGYNTLEVIRGALFHWIPVPFNGVPVWMELRTLNASQLDACGAMTLIDLAKGDSVADKKQIIDIRNKQESVIRAVCNRPTFDDIINAITGFDFVAREQKAKIDELKKLDLSGLSSIEKEDIAASIFNLELALAFIIPEDTMGFLTSWSLGVDVSDIKKLTREQLLDAAILATNGHDNPSDHLSGVFTDRDKEDINKTAWGVYNEYQADKQTEKNSKMRWVKSGRK